MPSWTARRDSRKAWGGAEATGGLAELARRPWGVPKVKVKVKVI